VASDLLSDHIVITIGRVMPAEHIQQKVVLVLDWKKNTNLLHLLAKEVLFATILDVFFYQFTILFISLRFLILACLFSRCSDL
jgi:hypothetical protein